MTRDIIKNESILTTIPEKYLHKLSDIQEWVIDDAVKEAILSNDTTVDANIGIGTLTIKFEDNQLRFRFKPGAKFVESLFSTIDKGENSLKLNLETSLVDKILHVYKELL